MQAESIKPAYQKKLSIDESDPIHQWKVRSQNLTISKSQDPNKPSNLSNSEAVLINSILNEADDIDFKQEKPLKERQEQDKNAVLAQITSGINTDFDSFIEKSKNVLKNIKAFNETVKKSEFNIEILAAKTNLQNRLNELTFKKDFRREERDKLKAQLTEIAQIEAEIMAKGEAYKEKIEGYREKKDSYNEKNDSYKDKNCVEKNKNDTSQEKNDNFKEKKAALKDSFKINIIREKSLKKDQGLNNQNYEHPIGNELEAPNSVTERESKISLTSFFDHKKGNGAINQIFNQENEKTLKKSIEYGLLTYETPMSDGKKIKNSKRLYESRFKQQVEFLSFKKKPSVVLTVNYQ